MFIGWGQNPYFSEYNGRGRLIFDGRFVDANAHYRAYRFNWSGNPQDLPAVAASSRRRKTSVFVSWNGATSVARWQVLAGSSPTTLKIVRTAAKGGFETVIAIPRSSYVAVQALDRQGHPLGKPSRTIRAG